MTEPAGMCALKPVSETGGSQAARFRAVRSEWIGQYKQPLMLVSSQRLSVSMEAEEARSRLLCMLRARIWGRSGNGRRIVLGDNKLLFRFLDDQVARFGYRTRGIGEQGGEQ